MPTVTIRLRWSSGTRAAPGAPTSRRHSCATSCLRSTRGSRGTRRCHAQASGSKEQRPGRGQQGRGDEGRHGGFGSIRREEGEKTGINADCHGEEAGGSQRRRAGRASHVVGHHDAAQECAPPDVLPVRAAEPHVAAHLPVPCCGTGAVADQGSPHRHGIHTKVKADIERSDVLYHMAWPLQGPGPAPSAWPSPPLASSPHPQLTCLAAGLLAPSNTPPKATTVNRWRLKTRTKKKVISHTFSP